MQVKRPVGFVLSVLCSCYFEIWASILPINNNIFRVLYYLAEKQLFLSSSSGHI